jgi:excisionase family DNA binding protein
MAQGYYTLDEAAQILNMPPDDLKQLARKGEIRSFQDRGTWRFRQQDIQELARQRGLSSEPDLTLGEASVPRPGDSGGPRSPGPRSPVKRSRESELFDFDLAPGDEHIGIGHEQLGGAGGPKSSGKTPKSGKHGPKSPAPASPPGSDSDVRLVTESSEDFSIAIDSDVKIVGDTGPSSKLLKGGSKLGKPGDSAPGGPGSDKRRKSGMPKEPADSGVRLVPLDSDSDVKIIGADSSDFDVKIGDQPPKSTTDSDIRLEPDVGPAPAGGADLFLTEEINLDAELSKADELKEQPQAKARRTPPPQPAFPSASPFELSESDLSIIPPEPTAGPDKPPESSSDFELTPSEPGSSPLEPSSSSEFELELPDDSVDLGDMPEASTLKGPASGINLQNPVDSGISLEQGGEGSDEIEFELSLDAESTPKPMAASETPSVDSDSEFELTLDDSGGLAPLEEEAPLQIKGDEEKDIFETDFEVPALEDESGSQAVALEDSETGLESSDFDLALSSDDIAVEEESGSQVVALDEEEETPHPGGRRGAAAFGEEQDFGDLIGDDAVVEEGVEEEEEVEEVVREVQVAAPPPPWGPLPALVMLPCVIVMFLVGLMGFELVQSAIGYRPPGMITKALGGLLGVAPKN